MYTDSCLMSCAGRDLVRRCRTLNHSLGRVPTKVRYWHTMRTTQCTRAFARDVGHAGPL